MATAVNIEYQIARPKSQVAASRERTRRITPEAGRGLELLGHAIEYLTDEYVNEAKKLDHADPQVAAIRLLMDLNRQIYYDCPAVPTFGERIRDFLRGAGA